jgi:hypothetical protein
MHSGNGFGSAKAKKVRVPAVPVPAPQHWEKEHGIARFLSVSAFYKIQKSGQRQNRKFLE